MRHGWILCILGIAFTGCTHEVQKVRIHPNCPEIPATTFKTAGLDAKAGSVKFGQLVTLGEISIKSDPQIISGVSQGIRDDEQTRALICDSKERGELRTEEQVAYAWKVARFHRANPNSDDVIRFYRENPFPSTTTNQRKETDTRHAAAIRKLIEEGYSLRSEIERDYRLNHRQPDYSSKEEGLVQEWKGKIQDWAKKAMYTLQDIDPLLVSRFNNVQASPTMIMGESYKWNSLNNFLNARIEFLHQYLDKI